MLAGLGRDPGIGSELRERVDRCEREDRVDDEADDEERGNRDEQTPDDVAAHRYPLTAEPVARWRVSTALP